MEDMEQQPSVELGKETAVATAPKQTATSVEEAPQVLEQETNIYSTAKSPSVVAEKDYASDIASNTLNNEEASKTYDYTSQGEKDYDTSVTTSSVQSGGGESITATWDSEYKLADAYKMEDDSEFSWNKLASEQANLEYQQQEQQARYESVEAMQEVNQAQTSAFNEYFAAAYSARQTQDKMGWSGGQQTASDLQVAFLQAETAANMYTQTEMQKYGVETKLATARLYAQEEQNSLAQEYYENAVSDALELANETGCYIPPETTEIMNQQSIAKQILDDPYASDADKARAEKVNKNCEAFYDAMGFTKWSSYDEDGNVVTDYYGVKVLQQLTLEETIRHNQETERLQEEANEINEAAVATSQANLRLTAYEINLDIAAQNSIEYKEAFENPKATYTSNGSSATYTVKSVDTSGNEISVVKTVPNGSTYVKSADGDLLYQDPSTNNIYKVTESDYVLSDATKSAITTTLDAANDVISSIKNTSNKITSTMSK